MQNDIEKIKETGTQVVGISFDSVEVLKEFSDDRKISFPLLSDEGSRAIRAYGIHNKDGVPHPGTYLVGQDGVITADLFLDGYRKRHSSEELIEAAAAK